MKRTDALKQAATKQGKPSNFLIFNQTNLTYFTNFSGAMALLISEQGEEVLYVSGVNYEQAKAEAKDALEETEDLDNVEDGMDREMIEEAIAEKLAEEVPAEEDKEDTDGDEDDLEEK